MDGQHRVGALRVLYGLGEFESRVLIEVLPQPDDAGVAALFTWLFSSSPSPRAS